MGGSTMSYDPKLLFEQISVCLNENPRKTLEELAQSLRVSKRTIKKTVRSLTGGNFRHYREEVLMERVKGFFAMPLEPNGQGNVAAPRRPAHTAFFERTGVFSNGSPRLRFPESFDQPAAPSCMTSRSLYLDGRYLIKNPTWHAEESAWKALQILRML